jgi:MFS family permease
MFLIGVVPALLTFFIRRGIPESPRWERSIERRRAAQDLRRQGAALDGEDLALNRFTLVDLFAEGAVRSQLIVTLIMSLSVTLGYWGVSSWAPSYVGSLATSAGLPAQRWVALAGLMQNLGALAGYFCFGYMADALGRKPTTALFYLMSLVLTPVVFLWVADLHVLLAAFAVYGFFVQGIFSWMPIWLPELYPTRMRGTAIAFCFNAPRLISWIGPLIAGTLIVQLGGFGRAASIVGLFYVLGLIAAPFLPETRGLPLPDTAAPPSPATAEQLRQPA